MNQQPSDANVFSFSSMGPSLSPESMSQSDEQTKDFQQPASSPVKGPAPGHDYAAEIFRRFHQHTLSESTAGSNDSSPTTTISTVDDSSATEPSPGSSPESPPPSNFAVGMLRPRTSDDSRPFFELQKQPPPRKGRNLKNLAVNTSRIAGRASSTTSLPLPAPNADSLPTGTSSTFFKPPTPPKRRPSNLGLTLLTPGGTTKAPPQEIRLSIPPTPALGRPGTLRHFQSSPSLPLVPTFNSHSNFGLPQVTQAKVALDTIFSPIELKPAESEEDEEQNFDIPLSREDKPEAYPDGPITVFEPHIDLYLEPTAEEARKYDVILNVAEEVRNPFVKQVESSSDEPAIRMDGGGGIQYAPKRDRILVEKTDGDSAQCSSPSTPKATPASSPLSVGAQPSPAQKVPEYIHVPWEHNSDIVPDLLRLCKLIDEKVLQGKRVLIHCQCGVSRSASLVVAYRLYKSPSMSVQEAYDAVKRRSKWIGPNMNLIMQLQEFRSSLLNGGLLPTDRGMTPITPSSAMREWRSPFSDAVPQVGPLSAGVAPLSKSQTSDALPALASGPSSAPSVLAWPLSERAPNGRARAISAIKPGTAYVNPSGRVIPVVPILNIIEPGATESRRPILQPAPRWTDPLSATTTISESPMSPRSEQFAMAPLQPSPEVDAADRFGLMSPTSTEFNSSPFDRSALLAQLGMGSVRQQDDELPRRTKSLRSDSKTDPVETNEAARAPSSTSPSRRIPRLRGRISSPSLREQQQLQSLQAKIEATHRSASTTAAAAAPTTLAGIDEALMSPRATEFTQNPFALSLPLPSDALSTATAHTPPHPTTVDSDPRSPASKGVSPITRNILDVL